MDKKTGGMAFPQHPSQDDVSNFGGMTLRDYFAAKAMQGILSNSWHAHSCTPENASMDAYSVADAMLKERIK